ncbi:MAG: DUF4935 domain-containing protein [Proteobacteria bacterium]|nr:DUF4935 domain-containing protein [Pseudomonadota bacterium]
MAQDSETTRAKVKSDGDKVLDPLILDRIYQDPLAAFLHEPATVAELKNDCFVFLDTNVLLIPYSTSKESLRSFTDIYKQLSAEGRLFLADRVMQEFEKNVPEKIKAISHSLVLGQNYNSQSIDFPLLEGLEEYEKLRATEQALKEKLEDFRAASKAALKAIEQWDHNDPVRKIYREVFANATPARITTCDEQQVLKNWKYRSEQSIPPGYKDSGKADTGIGDYLLWQAILDTCAKATSNAIVVSADSKADWWHRSDNQTLSARRELIEEFRRVTGGKTVRLLSPSAFLALYGAQQAIVDEVALEQDQVAERQEVRDILSISQVALAAAQRWLAHRLDGAVLERRNSTEIYQIRRSGQRVIYRFKVFRTQSSAVDMLKNYFSSERRLLGREVLIMVGTSQEVVERLLKNRYADLPSGGDVILGYFDGEQFLPSYFSNPGKNLDLALI